MAGVVAGVQRLILLVLDNAEDNLTAQGTEHEFGDQRLAEFVAAWSGWTGPGYWSPAVITSTATPRAPLAGGPSRRAAVRRRGPENDPAVACPGRPDRPAAATGLYRLGWPPPLAEYLDALLAGRQARFDDVADRRETALDNRGIHPPGEVNGQRGR